MAFMLAYQIQSDVLVKSSKHMIETDKTENIFEKLCNEKMKLYPWEILTEMYYVLIPM